MERFGEKLRLLRKRRGLTLDELADTFDYAGHAYLSKVENGKQKPSMSLVNMVAELFNVTMDELLIDELEIFSLEEDDEEEGSDYY